MKKYTNSFARSESGVAAIEFALVLPVMVVLFIGMLETWNIVKFDQKVQSAVFQIADMTTRQDEVSNNLLDNYADAISKIMDPVEFNGTVIFTSVASVGVDTDQSQDVVDATPLVTAGVIKPERDKIGCKEGCIVWQRAEVRGSAPKPASSRIGSVNGKATLPGDYTLEGTQNVLAVEMFVQREPLLDISRNIIAAFVPATVYRYAVFKPRQNALLAPPR